MSLFDEIRDCKKCKEDFIMNIPQPGYLNKNCRVLYLASNPGLPRKHEFDIAMKNRNLTEEEFVENYIAAIKLNKYYMKFIDLVYDDWEKLSILNIVKCPTKNNVTPTEEMINNCKEYTLQQIHDLKPKHIIAMGKVAQNFCYTNNLQLQYDMIPVFHYSYLIKLGILEREAKKVKEKLR